ncbi:MAG: flagellar hook-basal body complex protein, partial [Thioalkalispiraceae bacterium]
MPFRAALSGLNAASSDLRVIGHNIANTSTVGFKKSRAEFADVYAVSNLGVAANAIGSGVRVSNVAQQFTQGNVEFTDNNLDLAINGSGFFILSDSGSTAYTRAGTFSVDRDGYIVNNQSQRLQAFQADAGGNITGAVGDLQLNTSDIAPAATTQVDLNLNLDSRETVPVAAFAPTDPTSYNKSTSLSVYDSLGNPMLATMYYVKDAAVNTWNVYTYVTEPDGTTTEMVPTGGSPAQLTFDSFGDLTSVTSPVAGNPLAIDYNALPVGTGAVPL